MRQQQLQIRATSKLVCISWTRNVPECNIGVLITVLGAGNLEETTAFGFFDGELTDVAA